MHVAGLYIIGDIPLLRRSGHWGTLLGLLDQRSATGKFLGLQCPRHPNVPCAIDNIANFPGPRKHVCGLSCSEYFECGHKCLRPCHGEEFSHASEFCPQLVEKAYACTESPQHMFSVPCRKIVSNQPCPFYEIVRCPRFGTHPMIKRTCGTVAKCKSRCKTKLACGHQCQNICSEPCTQECKEWVKRKCSQDQEHVIKAYCYENDEEVTARCVELCSLILVCGHYCTNRCNEPCLAVTSCMECKAAKVLKKKKLKRGRNQTVLEKKLLVVAVAVAVAVAEVEVEHRLNWLF